MLKVDTKLLEKYDMPGPRYTSYPTAPFFHEGIGPDEYLKSIEEARNNKKSQELSLYFHLPFCDTLCYFCGCNMMVTRNRQKISTYLKYLLREIDLIQSKSELNFKVKQMHWGGGSPTYLTPEEIQYLALEIKNRFEIYEGAELGIEIDPRGLTREHMIALREAGFNRCSLGVQDFDNQVQKSVNRLQPDYLTYQTMEWARNLGFRSVNIDLMYGLPYQTVETVKCTLQKVIEMRPDRLAVFNYAHMPSKIKHQKLIPDNALPNAKAKLEILKLTIETLQNAGYEYIGMDHFAKPEDDLVKALYNGTLYRNFQGYSTHSDLDLIGFGISSSSQLKGLYIQNFKTLEQYYQSIDMGKIPVMRGVKLSEDDIIRRNVITSLMCHFKLDKYEFEKRYKIKFDKYFEESLLLLQNFKEDNLLMENPEKIQIHENGRLIIRNIAMAFDKYIQTKKENTTLFSRTI